MDLEVRVTPELLEAVKIELSNEGGELGSDGRRRIEWL